MSIADDIINGHFPDIETYLAEGNGIDDIDEYGFTLLIETAIVDNFAAAKALLERGAAVDRADVTGRTALHWAVDNENLPLMNLLFDYGCDVNVYNRGGQSPLVFPLLREQWQVKQALYQQGASLDFALDFINTKLIGHRFELSGDVDILNAGGEFIELDYEGFILEFSVDVLRNSLSQFRSNFAARSLRAHFGKLCEIIYGFEVAAQLLKYQHGQLDTFKIEQRLDTLINQPVLILPVAYRGHAIAFIRCGDFWAKCDRGENSKREGTVNLYYIGKQSKLDVAFYKRLLYQKQTERYLHHEINNELGLKHVATLPLSAQIAGNCSWANIEAVVPTAYMLMHLNVNALESEHMKHVAEQALMVYEAWLTFDKDRALYECIQGFKEQNAQRRASRAAILGAVLFQACDYGVDKHMERAEKILEILTQPGYRYVLDSYLQAYCVKRLTHRGNNLLKLLEDAGVDARIGVAEAATPLKKKKQRPT